MTQQPVGVTAKIPDRPHIQVMLVSAQAAANLLPALDPALKPERALLLTSQPMRDQARNLQSVLAEAGVVAEILELPDEHDFGAIQQVLLNWASNCDADDTIWLNATGGTKLMSLAALSVAETAGWRAFYLDLDTDQLNWLPAPGQSMQHTMSKHAVQTSLRLRHYLMSYGVTIKEVGTQATLAPGHAEFIQALLLKYEAHEPGIGLLNALAQRSEQRSSLTVEFDAQQRDSMSLHQLISCLEREHLATFDGLNARLTFANEAAREFAGGGWIEHHCLHGVQALHGELAIREQAINLQVQGAQDVRNELDIAFLAHNRMHVIECKTRRFSGRDAGERANEALFKLAENARRLGGLGTKAMFVSYRTLNDAEKRLARALNITVVQGSAVAQFKQHLRKWVGSVPYDRTSVPATAPKSAN